MTRGKGINKITGLDRPMTVSELQDISGMKQEAEATLKHAEEHQVAGAGEMLDKGRIKAEIARYDAILHEGAPARVSGSRKDALAKEVESIKEEMRKGMPTRDEMDHPSKNPGAVHKHMNWEKRNLKNIERFREIQRMLEPDDPTATNYDKLRKER